jgi:hypothetical protein
MALLAQSPSVDPSPQIAETIGITPDSSRFYILLYRLLLVLSVSLWFLAIRAPLWLDETGSWWQISKGFWQIPSRQGGLWFPAYSYILWFFSKILGSSEPALRIPSVLAMLGAVYLLYKATREIFANESGCRELAFITAILFSIHPIVVFESVDVRPYAFAILAVNASLYLLARLSSNSPTWMPIALGVSVAFIVYFHFLFAVILPFFMLCLFARVVIDHTITWRQAGIAIATCAIALLAVVPGLLNMVRSRGTHVFEVAPPFRELLWTLAPWFMFYMFVGALLVAAALRRLDVETRLNHWVLLLAIALGLVPIFTLWSVSAWTPIHMFVERHRLVAIPGIALCWGFLLSRINFRVVRALFCVAVVGYAASKSYTNPLFKTHGYTWKYALERAQKSASIDNAPILICSDLPESDHEPMPPADNQANVKDSPLLIPISYYQVSVPVVALPRALNDEAKSAVANFLQDPTHQHLRFLAMGFAPSWPTLQWIMAQAAPTHEAHVLGQDQMIAVVEFVPRSQE